MSVQDGGTFGQESELKTHQISFHTAAVVLFAVLAVAAAAPDGYNNYHKNGQPGCQTPGELSPNPLWRNCFDQGAYWECETLGVNAVYRRCEAVHGQPLTAFSPKSRKCVTQEEWQEEEWEYCGPPPSDATKAPETPVAPEVPPTDIEQ